MTWAEWLTLAAWTFATGALLGWMAHGVRRWFRPPAPPHADILAVMRIEIRGQGITCYFDAAALEEAAGLAGYILVKQDQMTSAVRH